MDDLEAEEGEHEFLEEEGEDELVSDEGEEAPEAVPIEKNKGQINQERRVETEESEISDINPDDYSDSNTSSEYDSDQLDPDTTANPHGFMYAHMLQTWQKSRRDRILEMKEERDTKAHRDKYKKKQSSKAIGKSEKVHAKNKPIMMVKHKKIAELRDAIKPLNKRKDRTRTFMGHFRKATKQRLDAKKRAKK